LGKFLDFELALQKRFLERRQVIHGLVVALVAKQHVLLIGPPGAAKSELAKAVCGAVGGRFFRTTLTPTSTPDELLGPVSAKRLIEDDVIARNLDGTLATADIAAIDEIWKCNAATLNSLLNAVNEREVVNAGQSVRIPLRTLVGTSNEMPQEESLTALWDRFSLRYRVDYLKDHGDFLALLGMPDGEDLTGPSLAEIDAASNLLPGVRWDGVKDTFVKIWGASRQVWRVPVSDRRWKWCLRLAQANALLAGRNEVQPNDLLVLADALWEEPDQQVKVRQGLLDLIDPALREAEELLDAAEEQWAVVMAADFSGSDDPAQNTQTLQAMNEAAGKIKKAGKRIEELRDGARGRGQDPSEIQATLERVDGYTKEAYSRFMAMRYRNGGV